MQLFLLRQFVATQDFLVRNFCLAVEPSVFEFHFLIVKSADFWAVLKKHFKVEVKFFQAVLQQI